MDSQKKDTNEFWISLRTSVLISIGLILVIIILLTITQNAYPCEDLLNTVINDVKNILIAIMTGLIFSFLLSLSWTKRELLAAFSKFIASYDYIDKLTDTEKKTLKDQITRRLHNTDIVSNKESLFNFLEKFDVFLSKPHQSVTTQTFIFKETDGRKDLLTLRREDDYRVHTLRIEQYKNFEVKQKITSSIAASDICTFLQAFSLVLIIGENTEDMKTFKISYKENALQENDCVTQSILDKKLELSDIFNFENGHSLTCAMNYSYDIENCKFFFEYCIPIELKDEFTRVNVKTTRIVSVDNFFSVRVFHPTYGHYCNLHFPENYTVKNVSHHQNLNIVEKQTIVSVNENNVNISTSGWQLPGMAFALSYCKKD
jgi:hypothetical protein